VIYNDRVTPCRIQHVSASGHPTFTQRRQPPAELVRALCSGVVHRVPAAGGLPAGFVVAYHSAPDADGRAERLEVQRYSGALRPQWPDPMVVSRCQLDVRGQRPERNQRYDLLLEPDGAGGMWVLWLQRHPGYSAYYRPPDDFSDAPTVYFGQRVTPSGELVFGPLPTQPESKSSR